MSNDLLKQILNKLENMEAEQQSMKTQLDENTRLTRALYDRQEKTECEVNVSC
ncbi:hypothetical protein ACE106_15500 [Shouchella clausii]|jgi:Skp family chaperone for outer membrane proteins|uniref:hypothetical protein n=1 Tax=Shouchella clausii TaxID=79880 RepID=UPI00289E573A|nr:hypothetical protein [Shouchella clausii]